MPPWLLSLFQKILQELGLQICLPEQLRTESAVSLLAAFALIPLLACETIAFAVLLVIRSYI